MYHLPEQTQSPDTVVEDTLPCEFLVREALYDCEVREAYALRRTVFCIEQGIFPQDDRDDIDDHAQLLVALACQAGMPLQVVGTVRIHSPQSGIWWGSRLAVHPAFRKSGHLGATLIKLAVSRANAQGCNTFFAHIQKQNVPLFEKLHWRAVETALIHARQHVLMQADLAHYPACHDAVSGFVTCHGKKR